MPTEEELLLAATFERFPDAVAEYTGVPIRLGPLPGRCCGTCKFYGKRRLFKVNYLSGAVLEESGEFE